MITKKITVIFVSILFTKIVIWQLSLIGLEYFFFFLMQDVMGRQETIEIFLSFILSDTYINPTTLIEKIYI